MPYCFRSPTKDNFLCLLFWIWVKTDFPLQRSSTYLSKVVIQSRAEVLLSWITENINVSSANSLKSEDNPSDKFLIYIKNNNGPSVGPWGTPALTSDQSETCLINKTICFLFLRKFHERFIPFCINTILI